MNKLKIDMEKDVLVTVSELQSGIIKFLVKAAKKGGKVVVTRIGKPIAVIKAVGEVSPRPGTSEG